MAVTANYGNKTASRQRHIAIFPRKSTNGNIVGYNGIDTEEQRAPIVGAMFKVVGGGDQFDLRSLVVPGTYKASGKVDEYMDPYTECLRVLSTDSSATIGRYTYISKEFIIENVDKDWEPYAWAIGWWTFDTTGKVTYEDYIEGGDDSLMVKNPLMFPNGTAFLGSFSERALKVQSNGEVITEPFAFATEEARAPFFANPLPVDIDLSDIVVPGTYKASGKVDEYMDPYTECFRELSWDSSATINRYTYISKEFIIENVDKDWEPYAWAIGWWTFDTTGTVTYEDYIDGGDDSLMIKKAVPVKAGTGFLGSFSERSLDIVFPSALDIPSKK